MAFRTLKEHKKLIYTLVLVISGFFIILNAHKRPADSNKPGSGSGRTKGTSTAEERGTTPGSMANGYSGAINNGSDEQSKLLAQNPGFKEIRYYLLGTVTDPLYNSSWYHSQVQTARAWDLTTGSDDVEVAVIDSGFALNHEDLANKWVINAGEDGQTSLGGACWTGVVEDKKTNSCDDDSNGYVDDWRGYDFFNQDNDVATGLTNPSGDATSHGSMVAGMVAASANNAKGSTGIDQAAKIMPLQVFSDDGEAYTSDIVTAIEYAVDNGAKIINLSLGTNGYDPVLLSAIRYAKSHGVLVVAASGNCALNDESFCNNLSGPGRMTYPALYPETMAVGATTQGMQRATFSSYGSNLDIVAPGQSVGALPYYTAGNPSSGYTNASGTSFSAPLVAGIASLLIAQKPDITPDQIDYILKFSADKPSIMGGAAFSEQFGYGIVNAHKATLLGLAKTQDNLLGARKLSPNEPSVGRIWRAASSNIASDESVLVGCRVAIGQVCSVVVENGSNSKYYFANKNPLKGDVLQYIFVKGSEVPSGNWKISVHNNSYGTLVTNLTR